MIHHVALLSIPFSITPRDLTLWKIRLKSRPLLQIQLFFFISIYIYIHYHQRSTKNSIERSGSIDLYLSKRSFVFQIINKSSNNISMFQYIINIYCSWWSSTSIAQSLTAVINMTATDAKLVWHDLAALFAYKTNMISW